MWLLRHEISYKCFGSDGSCIQPEFEQRFAGSAASWWSDGAGSGGFALLDITIWFLVLYYVFPALLPNNFISTASNPLPIITATMLSFGMGASTQALFAAWAAAFIPKQLMLAPTW